jgi:hypothetical protein
MAKCYQERILVAQQELPIMGVWCWKNLSPEKTTKQQLFHSSIQKSEVNVIWQEMPVINRKLITKLIEISNNKRQSKRNLLFSWQRVNITKYGDSRVWQPTPSRHLWRRYTWYYQEWNLCSTTPEGNIKKLHTWTTSVHLGSASKFLVWIAKGDSEKIGSAQGINSDSWKQWSNRA